MTGRNTDKEEILFVDDEAFFAARYIENLSREFTVHFADNATTALHRLENSLHIKALVLDIMMPAPHKVPLDQTAGGLDTGIWLLRQIQENHIAIWPFPVLILTNRNVDLVKTLLRDIQVSERYVEVRKKLDTPAFIINTILKAHIANVDSRM